MKIVLFDLGRTLEHNDVLLPGAVQTLEAIGNLRDMDGSRWRWGWCRTSTCHKLRPTCQPSGSRTRDPGAAGHPPVLRAGGPLRGPIHRRRRIQTGRACLSGRPGSIRTEPAVHGGAIRLQRTWNVSAAWRRE